MKLLCKQTIKNFHVTTSTSIGVNCNQAIKMQLMKGKTKRSAWQECDY